MGKLELAPGNMSAIMSIYTASDSRTVIVSETFSPLSAGRRKTSAEINDINRHGNIIVTM